MGEKSKILIIGGTGYIGKHIVEASAKAGYPTFALIRESTLSDPTKATLLNHFNSLAVHFIPGDLYDHDKLVEAIKQVDVVISAVGHFQLPHQLNIISAIKEAGNIKRFLPSDFGNDVDRVHAVEPAKSFFAVKAQIRRSIEAEGIPYTYVSTNCFAGYFLPTFAQPGATAPPPPKHNVTIIGDGNTKAIFNAEEDIGTYTIRAVDDPRTLNKILYIRPPKNIYSFNEVVSLWEKKIGNTLHKTYCEFNVRKKPKWKEASQVKFGSKIRSLELSLPRSSVDTTLKRGSARNKSLSLPYPRSSVEPTLKRGSSRMKNLALPLPRSSVDTTLKRGNSSEECSSTLKPRSSVAT